MRWWAYLFVAVLLGACASADGQSDSTTTTAAGPGSTSTTTSVTPSTSIPETGEWLLAWQPSEMIPGFAEQLSALPGVEAVSLVRVGDGALTATARADGTPVDSPTDGFVIPVEIHAFAADVHAGFLPEPQASILRAMGPDEVMLGSTSARLRRLEPGDEITFDNGITTTVAGIVDDRYVGDAEIVTTMSNPEILTTFLDKYVVFFYDGDRDLLETALSSFEGDPVTVRSQDEVLRFRHGDSVRSQVAFKDRFGEFTIRPDGGGFLQEPAWRRENIVTESVPLLGRVTCHKEFIPMLRQAMEELEAAGRSDAIAPRDFAGCWNARFIANRRAISHHSFGAAVDVNFFRDLDGPASPIDPDLLAAMEAAGMTSGHIWVNPDPGHFEWFSG